MRRLLRCVRWKPACATIAALIVVAIVWRIWISQSPPRIVLGSREINLSRCRFGEEYPISVPVANRGGRMLELQIASVSCGCSKVRLERNALRRGESTALVGTFRAGSANGQFSSTVVISSNDPDTPLAEVIFKGTIEPYLEVSPQTLVLSPDIHKPAVAPLRIRNTDDKPVRFAISLSGVPAECRKAQFTLGPQAGCVVDFSCKGDVIHFQQGSIHLTTDHRIQPTITVPIQVAPRRGISVFPPSFRFGLVSRSQLVDHRFSVSIRGELTKSARIVRIDVPEFLQLDEQSEDDATGVKRLSFSFAEACTPGAVQGTISVVVALSGEPLESAEIPVPISGIIR